MVTKPINKPLKTTSSKVKQSPDSPLGFEISTTNIKTRSGMQEMKLNNYLNMIIKSIGRMNKITY